MDTLIEPELVIDGGEPVPQQLQTQIRLLILYGVLRPGEELPTVREIAVELAVNPHAVEEAYGRLEREGFLVAGEGCGPRVAPPPEHTTYGALDNWCRGFLQQTTAAGYSPAEVVQALLASLDEGTGHG
jgi:GntR family transcriptional regulator